MSLGHPQIVPVKMSPHTSMFFLSPADCMVLTAGAKASPIGMWVPPAAPQTCWAVGAHTWGCGRAAQHRIHCWQGYMAREEESG